MTALNILPIVKIKMMCIIFILPSIHILSFMKIFSFIFTYHKHCYICNVLSLFVANFLATIFQVS
jgi:hypothetical protein